jgi:hypothetical protein
MGGSDPWVYVPTPQPGESVFARVCKRCGKRAKRPKWRITRHYIEGTGCWVEKQEDGRIRYKTRVCQVSNRVFKRRIKDCCSHEHEEVLGLVERTTWSFYKNGAIKSFFLIVFVPSTGKRHWATIDTVRLATPLTALSTCCED